MADFNVTPSGMSAWIVNGQSNPGLTLTRGHTYTFAVNAPGHPLDIKTFPGAGPQDVYGTGVTGNGVSSGTLTFTVPANAPNPLYYQCEFHDPMSGMLTIVSAPASVPATPPVARGLLGVGLVLLAFAVLGKAGRAFRRVRSPASSARTA